MRKQLKNFFTLIRINQWVKNGFVFLPLFFDKKFTSLNILYTGFVAFLGFSLVASAIYCFNDSVDITFDKNHPQKKYRPLVSGAISKKQAQLWAVVLLLSSVFITCFFNSIELAGVMLIYSIMNILYTLLLKNLIIVDVITIALSFVLRIVAGGVATNTELSYWIIIMVFLLALFLALAKRRDEVLIYQETKITVRRNIKKYSLSLINTLLTIIGGVIIVAYVFYTLSDSVILHFENEYIYITSIFVVLGFFRYYTLIKNRAYYANPTRILLSDLILQAIVLGWLICFYLLIY